MFTHLRKNIKFTEKKTRFYGAELILALKWLHDNKIIYRDLKPENIILGSDGHIKITDFGLSKMNINKENDLTFTFWGTPEYLAPEIISQKGHDKSVDWWSLGIIIFEMLMGKAPFTNKNKQKVLKDVLKAPLPPNNLSKTANDLVEKLLVRDPKKRLGFGERDALDIMEHPFFEEIDWEKLALREVVPPFIPKVKKQDDLRHIDPLFKDEKVKDTPAEKKLRLSEKEENHFSEFTYSRDLLINETKLEPEDDLSQIVEEIEDSFAPVNSEELELNL